MPRLNCYKMQGCPFAASPAAGHGPVKLLPVYKTQNGRGTGCSLAILGFVVLGFTILLLRN